MPLNPVNVGLIVFAFSFGGALFGFWLRSILPTQHFHGDAKETVKMGIGLVATMTALVLGLVTASAKSSFDAANSSVTNTAHEILMLDRILARYGPETTDIRKAIQLKLASRIEYLGSQQQFINTDLNSDKHEIVATEHLADAIRRLKPADDFQRSLQARAASMAEDILQTRWLEGDIAESSIPIPFMVLLLLWLTVAFTIYGLISPFNFTVASVLFVCALSVASAVFIVMEMDSPFSGLLRVSTEPLEYAHAHMGL